MELSLLAERLPDQAQEWGLVNRLFDDQDALMSGAMDVANRLANGPKSLSLIRKHWKTWSNSTNNNWSWSPSYKMKQDQY